MKSWDFNSGASKLVLALQSLQAAETEAQQYWSDEAHGKFHETYLAPLEPKVRSLLDSVHRLAEVLAGADRECGMTRD